MEGSRRSRPRVHGRVRGGGSDALSRRRAHGRGVGRDSRDLDLTETAVRRWGAQAEIDARQREWSDQRLSSLIGRHHPRHFALCPHRLEPSRAVSIFWPPHSETSVLACA